MSTHITANAAEPLQARHATWFLHHPQTRQVADLEQLQEHWECAIHDACQGRPVLFVLELVFPCQNPERKESSIEPPMILRSDPSGAK